MSQRIKSQDISRRPMVAARTSSPPELRVQADLNSARGHSAIGAAASDVFGRLGEAANRITLDLTARKFTQDQTQGQKDRTVETLGGADAQAPESLEERTAGYRRGYFLTEAANRLHATKLEAATEAAKLEPGEDINPVIQQRMAEMLQRPEFQDPTILRQLQPAIQAAQEGIVEQRQKTELAEIFERQSENFRTMARDGIRDGSLRTPHGVQAFRALLDTEPFAHLSKDEADDILSEQFAELFSTGEIDPETAMEFLKTPLSEGETPLLDRKGWQDKFQAAVGAGVTVRQKQYEEKQAEYLSSIEYGLQQRAARGGLAESTIMAEADKAGMVGKDRLAFVRRWIDQNDAGLKHMQSEANRAKEHKETIAAITAGNALSLTDSKLTKSAEKEWAAAVAGGDSKVKQSVIERYTRAGIVIPQLADMLGRTTERNLTANYNLYAELVKIDRIAADRYLSESNAALFAQHHDNITQFGMSPEESIQSIPTGATKGKRSDVASATSQAAARYFKDNPTMSDGSPRTRAVQAQIEQQAIRLGLANPNASSEDNLKVAERRVMGGLIQVNGHWVSRGGARTGTEPGIEAVTNAVARRLVKRSVLTPEVAAGVYAAPLPQNPNVFAVMLPNGYPAADTTQANGEIITFDPLEAAQLHRQFENERAEARVRHSQAAKARDNAAVKLAGINVEDAAAARLAVGRKPTPGQFSATTPPLNLNPSAKPADDFQFPEFLEFVQGYKRKRRDEQGQQ